MHEQRKKFTVTSSYTMVNTLFRFPLLNLWCEGIRKCEVCVIKAGMYSYDGQDAWLKLYQNKMKKELH